MNKARRDTVLTRAALLRDLALWTVLLVLSCLVALSFGPGNISWWRGFSGSDPFARELLVGVRLPRVLLGVAVGASLGSAGAALQGLLRNPLADPYLLGLSGGAALGGASAVLLSSWVGGAWLGWLGAGLPGFFSFLGAVGAISLVWRLARVSGGVSPFTLLLAGAVTNAFAAAVVTFLQAIVAAQDAQRIFFWLIGTLGGLPSWGGLAIAGAGSLVMGLGLWFLAPSMNLLALGEDAAAHGGVEVRSLQRRVFFLVSLGVGLAVAASGLIGFVGMLTPHTLRLAYGSDARRLFPLSALAGASFLVLCDAGARMMFQWFGTEPPVGVITAMLGGPFFLWLLHRRSAQP